MGLKSIVFQPSTRIPTITTQTAKILRKIWINHSDAYNELRGMQNVILLCQLQFLEPLKHSGLMRIVYFNINPLTPNNPYSGLTAPLTSKRCILYIYSTNIGTEYFKHGIHSPFFFLQNAVCFIMLTYLVTVLFTFYIQGELKFIKIIPAPKGLNPYFPQTL